MHATFLSSEQLADGIMSFSFKPEREFTYTAGQFIELTLDGHTEHGKPAKREFTLSSSPHEELLTITTRAGDHKKHSAYKRALATLEAGAPVTISEPYGDFVLPKLQQTPIVLVAGGIGITPYRSIAKWLEHTKEDRNIQLIYSVRTEDDIIFQDAFDDAKLHMTIVVNQASGAWGGERGVLTGEMITGLTDPNTDSLIYVSGPEPFVQSLCKQLQEQGVSNQNIVVDEFQGYDEV